jgi:transposase-like protein
MNTPNDPSANGRKRYTPAIKQEALALVAAGRSMSQVSRDLGVSVWTLGEWKKQSAAAVKPLAAGDAGEMDPASLAAEVARLRKALAKSELHADILKKALAIVGQPLPDSSR